MNSEPQRPQKQFVILKPGTTPHQRAQIREAVQRHPDAEHIEIITEEQAAERGIAGAGMPQVHIFKLHNTDHAAADKKARDWIESDRKYEREGWKETRRRHNKRNGKRRH